tara:strand:+ start:494 stop:1513 length:1020 start_codon:yes stop_codon:yes gene_type:complete
MNYFLILFTPILIYLLTNFLRNKSLLLNYSGDKHQNYTLEKKIPLSGGIFIALYFLIFFFNNTQLIIFATLIFFLGFFSDLKIFNSAKFRFILQLLIIFSFIFFNDILLQNTKVIFIDQLLKNEIYNYFFVLFCILILVNGTNFIDGLNTNVLGYYITISLFVFLTNQDFFQTNFTSWIYWISILIILYLFNFSNKLFIGDSGSYFLGFVYGFLLIEIYLSNTKLSPFFIILLVWYPCFELLFSIIRKFRFKKSPILPDTKHLHQLLYIFIKKKLKIKNIKANICSASIINLFNISSIFLGSLNVSNTQYQVFLILINVFVYCYVYFNLFNNLYFRRYK